MKTTMQTKNENIESYHTRLQASENEKNLLDRNINSLNLRLQSRETRDSHYRAQLLEANLSLCAYIVILQKTLSSTELEAISQMLKPYVSKKWQLNE